MRRKPFHRTKPGRVLAVVVLLGGISAVLVGGDVLVRHVAPAVSTGTRHFLLTVVAALATTAVSTGVYVLMHRHNARLSAVAEQLSGLLRAYVANPDAPHRFENPHLVRCDAVMECGNPDCPMRRVADDRCWQTMALKRGAQDVHKTSTEIERCHECAVYRLSCPDKLTELGESFNNLLFLLGQESRRLKYMRDQMLEKEKMVSIGQLASGIAHEVANPLSSISSIVQVLKRSGSANDYMTEQFGLIETHIQRITGIVRKVGTLARRGPERWEPVDVDAALREAVRLVSFDRRARPIEIRVESSPHLPRVMGLAGQLEQVFINLSLNALDAMPEGGVLTVRARHENGSIVVQVSDTGCGIPPEVGRRIFEPFYTTKEPGRGTGLGLAVSYGIVEKHGGTIDLDSVVDEGTTFTVTLPIRDSIPDRSHVSSHSSAR